MLTIQDLKPNPKNPRTITEAKLKMLKNALAEFGDLGGFVFNKKTNRLVGGHQRAKAFDKSAKVVIDKKYSKPTKTGTIAEGFIELKGERFRYREVQWDALKEKAANIAANKGAGEWEMIELSNWMRELDGFFDLDLTMFDSADRLDYLNGKKVDVSFKAGVAGDQGQLDSKSPIECPHCHKSFIPK